MDFPWYQLYPRMKKGSCRPRALIVWETEVELRNRTWKRLSVAQPLSQVSSVPLHFLATTCCQS